jgi:hypothetical protein
MANVMELVMTGRKQAVDVVVWAYWMRKRKISNKWRMVDDENSKRLDCSLP